MSADNLARQADNQDRLLSLAQMYAEQLEAGESAEAAQTLALINQQQRDARHDTDSVLFRQVGQLTRDLHDSMKHFMQDSQFINLMQEDMPDARQRLNHVIELTERSAHDTMASIEHSLPLVAVLQQRAAELGSALHGVGGDGVADDGRLQNAPAYLAEELQAFLARVETDSKKIADDLNDIMMAQSYQDLTGQIIQRVITLVQDVEQNLVGLLQLGIETGHTQQTAEASAEADRIGHGPAIPQGGKSNERCESQDDVDDLLSTLGF